MLFDISHINVSYYPFYSASMSYEYHYLFVSSDSTVNLDTPAYFFCVVESEDVWIFPWISKL